MNTHFSSSLKEIISLSREEAIRLHSDTIGTGHLLLALIRQDPVTNGLLHEKAENALPEIQKEIEAGIALEQAGPKTNTGKAMVSGKRRFFNFFQPPSNGLPLNRKAEKAIRVAVTQADDRQSPQVEPVHLMLAILKNTEDPGTRILSRYLASQSSGFLPD